MEANPAPTEPSQCIAVTTRRPRCESTPPPQTTGNCFAFWFVRNRDEEPVKLELHRLAEGIRKVRYDGQELAGDWLLGNGGHEDDPNVFMCNFELEEGREVAFRFEQVKASNTYRFCGPRPDHESRGDSSGARHANKDLLNGIHKRNLSAQPAAVGTTLSGGTHEFGSVAEAKAVLEAAGSGSRDTNKR